MNTTDTGLAGTDLSNVLFFVKVALGLLAANAGGIFPQLVMKLKKRYDRWKRRMKDVEDDVLEMKKQIRELSKEDKDPKKKYAKEGRAKGSES